MPIKCIADDAYQQKGFILGQYSYLPKLIGAQWLSVRLEIKGLLMLVRDSAEVLHCFLEQDTLSCLTQ